MVIVWDGVAARMRVILALRLAFDAGLAVAAICAFVICAVAAPTVRATPILDSHPLFAESSDKDLLDAIPDISSLTSLSLTNPLIQATSVPTISFSATTSCFEDCPTEKIGGGKLLSALLNGAADDSSGTSVANTIKAAMALTAGPDLARSGAAASTGSPYDVSGSARSAPADMEFTASLDADTTSVSFNTVDLNAANNAYVDVSANTGQKIHADGSTGDCMIGRDSNCLLAVSSVPSLLPWVFGIGVLITFLLFSRS